MTQRKLRYEEIETLRCYRSWYNRVCEYGLFSKDDSHFVHTQKMIEHGTTDGKPWVEPELTDEDAKQRPWVMVRDRETSNWIGPKTLVAKSGYHYVLNGETSPNKELQGVSAWRFARPATPEEIEAANAER
jgi:hypothetical protein